MSQETNVIYTRDNDGQIIMTILDNTQYALDLYTALHAFGRECYLGTVKPNDTSELRDFIESLKEQEEL